MKYYLVAGEASGDLHASNLMKGILANDNQAEFRFFGGDLMQSVGGELALHYRSMAFMGFLEVLQNLRTISKNLDYCKNDILAYKPDVVILVDYPGFNLRIAKFCKSIGLKVFYYIAPKVWAWKEGRIETIRKYVDQLYVIFPFEIDYFKKKGIDVVFEGNPTLDAIEPYLQQSKSLIQFAETNLLQQKPIVALLAGSRKQEIKHNLPYMLSIANHFPQFQFIIAGAPSLSPSVYQKHIAGTEVKVIFGKTYELLSNSTIAIVTSGTATLETALLNIPQVVCYRGSFLSMLIAWMVVKVKYISLVNLITGRESVRELIQYDLTHKTLLEEVRDLLPGESKHQHVLSEYKHLKALIGNSGASERVGRRIVNNINDKK